MANKPVLFITGASRGIGAATALLASELNYDLALNYRTNRQRMDQVADQCRQAGARVMLYSGDVSDEATIISIYNQIESDLGTVTHLVNNAGILHTQDRVENLTAERIREVFNVNVLGSMICAREMVRRFLVSELSSGAKTGAIVNLSSVAASRGSANEYVDYASTKGAIDTFTIGLAKEVAAQGLRVNSVRPGLIKTEIHASSGEPDRVSRLEPTIPMGRGGTPIEVANAVIWMLSDQASYVTGALLDVSGGR